MKFGAVPESRLASIDLSLPKEPFINTLVLPGVRAAEPGAYVGAATWGDPSWAGMVYPPKTPATRYRQLYPQYFSAIEFNATHYRIYPPEQIRQWAAAARGKDFKFCPKFPQEISHHSNFRNAGESTAAFLDSIAAFEKNLGPLFLQVSETFSPAGADDLFHYLAALPKGPDVFLEVRHPSWFADIAVRENLFNTLRELGVGAVITDTPGRRDAVHMYLSIPKVLIRFVSNSLHPSSFSRTDEWISCLSRWIDAGLEEAYIFLHPGDEKAIPELAKYWVKGMNDVCGLQIPEPVYGQQKLF